MNDRLASFAAGIGFAGLVGLALRGTWAGAMIDAMSIVLASALSQLGWWGAIFIGFVHRHVEHNIPWPENPWIFIAVVIATIIGVVLVGEIVLRNKNKI